MTDKDQIQSADKRARSVQGTVISDKMDKTRTVLVERQTQHPLYKKYIKRSVKFHVHDENNESSEGDTVLISETRPMSKTKSWRLEEIVRKAL